MPHHPTRAAGSSNSYSGQLLVRAIRAAILTGAGGAVGLVATAAASHAATAPPSPTGSSAATSPAAGGRVARPSAARSADPTVRRVAVRATHARATAPPATAPATSPAPADPSAGPESASVSSNVVDRTEGGAIGGIEVAGPTSTMSPGPDTAPGPAVSAPGTPASTAASEAAPATIVATDPASPTTGAEPPATTDPATTGSDTPATTGSAPATTGDSSVGNNSSNTAVATQPVDVTVVDQQPIVIVGATGDTTINITLGGTVTTTVTAVATNTSDGSASVTTGIEAQTTSQVQVTSAQPVTVSSQAGAVRGTSVVTGNSSRNVAVVSQAPHVVVVQSIPIVLVHPDGRVTINTVIAGVVITRVVGVGANTSNGQGALAGGGAGTALATGNESTNRVIVIQTPDITVVFEIPITIIDPQGPVDIHALIAGVVDTQMVAVGTNESNGTAITDGTSTGGSPTGVNDGSVTDRSSSSVMIVQAPHVSLQQQVPITITNPVAPVHIDATIASLITTTLQAAAGNSSSGTLVAGGATFTTHSTDGTIQVLQDPTVDVHSAIPVTVDNPSAPVQISTLVADVVRTVVHQTLAAGEGSSVPVATPPTVGDPSSGGIGVGALRPGSVGPTGRSDSAPGEPGHQLHAVSTRLTATSMDLTPAAAANTVSAAHALAGRPLATQAASPASGERPATPTASLSANGAWWQRAVRTPYLPVAVLAAGLAVAGLTRRHHLLRLLRRPGR